MSSNNIILEKENLETYFSDLGKLLKKKIKNNTYSVELIVVGGASIILNYDFRGTTVDIDCIDVNGALMNEVVGQIADKYDLPEDWINTDFVKTASYSSSLIRYSTLYKTYGNGVLSIRTIKGEYLIAMKIMSGRKYKNDYSDIYGIIKWHKRNNKQITIDEVDKAIVELYGSLSKVDKDAYNFTSNVIKEIDSNSLNRIREKENVNLNKLKELRQESSVNEETVEKILEKIL